jgi:protein SCO1/2
MISKLATGWAVLAALCMTTSAWAYDTKPLVIGKELPAELKDIGVDEHLGASLDLSTPFVDDAGQTATLGQYINGEKPTLMAMVYYTCPSLCNYHLNGLTETMKQLKWTAGKDFNVVAVSMNSKEGPDVAGPKKHNYLKVYDRHSGDEGWHFLTGTEENVQKLARELGFKFKWNAEQKQFAHVSVAYVLTPEGKISRYLHGISIEPQTLRLALLEASNGKIGNIADQAVMFCFAFDPHKSKYTIQAWNVMRLGGILMVLLMAIFLIPVWWRGFRTQPPRT